MRQAWLLSLQAYGVTVFWSRPECFQGQHLVVGDLPYNYYMRPFGDGQTYMGSINPDMSRQEKYPQRPLS
ncbi:MAG: hypothetical protein QXT90_00095 [Candidatus Caldarchaeum sp.]